MRGKHALVDSMLQQQQKLRWWDGHFMSRRADWVTQIGLYNDYYALYLPLVSSVVVGPGVDTLSVGGVLLLSGRICRSHCVLGSDNGEQT